ncbi:MAG: choloylglycine hydrolase family protein [Clostridia bacterium]|nr:choloylglycine hydrolase family protein [Clostridia bacterium]
MCTAIQWNGCFGRNLDLWCSYGESVVITPGQFPFRFRCGEAMPAHYAMIGMAHVADGYPLYYEAMNEKGLAMAGLNFPGNALYHVPGTAAGGQTELAPWELIPWILGNFASAGEVREAFGTFRVVNTAFREDLPNTPLHWMIADRNDCLVLECTADGQTMTADPVGVLTNSPEVACHLYRLQEYMHLSPKTPENRFFPHPETTPGLPGFVPFTDTFHPCSGGMGAVGLPGDWSSASRFVKAAYLRANAIPGETAEGNMVRFFHMLEAVAMPAGAVIVPYQGEEVPEITVYACCMDLTDGVYYYKTHENSRITAVDLHGAAPDGTELVIYPMETKTDIRYVNRRREEDV